MVWVLYQVALTYNKIFRPGSRKEEEEDGEGEGGDGGEGEKMQSVASATPAITILNGRVGRNSIVLPSEKGLKKGFVERRLCENLPVQFDEDKLRRPVRCVF